MNSFVLPKKAARLIVLQRIELAGNILKKIRKLFGRYFFSNFITKYFLNSVKIGNEYYKIMHDEFLTINKFISDDDNLFLSIGAGVGGLEAIINQNLPERNYFFIEKNYISKKVKYGWTGKSKSEAYNSLDIQKEFLLANKMNDQQINIIDFDAGNLPMKKFDIITSFFSLDYHYDFHLYSDYLKKVSKKNTKIIFDTIRADFFKKIFKNVEIIKSRSDTVHKSRRIMCSEFIEH
ncbi:class I SAM-dependent methyltransferase [Candidatus Pelagibacter sp.]|nr:class I SAM-dependent methyltransferase [Candidatus Pelagibacter sp.]